MSTRQVTSTVGKGTNFPNRNLPLTFHLETWRIWAIALMPKWVSVGFRSPLYPFNNSLTYVQSISTLLYTHPSLGSSHVAFMIFLLVLFHFPFGIIACITILKPTNPRKKAKNRQSIKMPYATDANINAFWKTLIFSFLLFPNISVLFPPT